MNFYRYLDKDANFQDNSSNSKNQDNNFVPNSVKDKEVPVPDPNCTERQGTEMNNCQKFKQIVDCFKIIGFSEQVHILENIWNN